MHRIGLIGAALAAAVALAGCAGSVVSGTGSVGASSPAPSSAGGFPSATSPSGSNAALSADALEHAAKAALTSATAFRMSGTIVEGPTHIVLDIHYGRSSSDGWLQVAGQRVQLRYVAPAIFMKAGASFWQTIGGIGSGSSARDRAALALLTDKWVRLRGNIGGFGQIRDFAIRTRFLAQAGSSQPGSTYSRGPSKTIDGTPAVSFVDHSDGTVVYVPASGTPYPIRIEDHESGGGRATFSLGDWNVPFSAPYPPKSQIVDLPH